MSRSTMEDVMNTFRDVVDAPYEKLRLWKEANQKKVIGCSPMHFPEELIHAAGMLPVVLQETDEAITTGFSHVHPFYCGITRNIIDVAVKGQLSFFDGLIYSDICIQNRNAACTLRQMMPASYVEYVQLPTSLSRDGVTNDSIRELARIRVKLEGLAGHKIDDTSLKESIVLFNRNRLLLRQLHELRRANPSVLSSRDMQVIVKSSMLMPKEEHNTLMESLVTELERAKPSVPEGKRLFLSGHLCQSPKADILDLIEGVGGIIVDDDLYTGYRYYAVDVRVDEKPIEALAERYLEKTLPIPTRSYLPMRWEKYLVERAEASKAQGVVVLVAKYCEPHLFSYPFLKEALEFAGMPHIMLETEHEVVSLEAVRTRLQAFVEMLE
jgi:benzoyl-CoA reductase subunit C